MDNIFTSYIIKKDHFHNSIIAYRIAYPNDIKIFHKQCNCYMNYSQFFMIYSKFFTMLIKCLKKPSSLSQYIGNTWGKCVRIVHTIAYTKDIKIYYK